MPRAQQSVIGRLTNLFMDLDGGEMETVLDVFKTVHARRTAPSLPQRLTIGVEHGSKTAKKVARPRKKAAPPPPPYSDAEYAEQAEPAE